jgi:hypothetical protein
MATPTIGNTASYTTTGTKSFTNNGDTLVVCIQIWGTPGAAPTYNGVSMTLKANSGNSALIYVLDTAPQGTYNLVYSASPALIKWGVMSVVDADASDAVRASAAAVAMSVNVNSQAGDLVIDSACLIKGGTSPGAYLTVGSGQAQKWNQTQTGSGGSMGGGASTKAATSSSTNMYWTPSGSGYYEDIAAISIKPKGGFLPIIWL